MPETGEAGGQPQWSLNGAGWGNTTNVLVAIGNGRYYVEFVAATEVNSLGIIEGRYKSANTAEAIGTTLQVVPYDPYDGVRLGLTALPNAAADGIGGLPISDAGGLDLDAKLANTNEVTAARMAELDAANLPTDVAAIKTDTAAVLLDTGTDGVVLPQAQADKVWGTAARTLTSFGTLITDIWHQLLTAITTAGSVGKLIKDYLDSAISGRAAASVCTETRLAELDAANIPADMDTLKTRVPSALSLTAGNVHSHTKATDVGGDATLANQVAIKAVTDKIDTAMELDIAVYRFTENALEQAPSGAGLTETQNTALILIRDIMEGDATINTATTPWQLIVKKKSTGTEVLKKNLKDANGNNITKVTTVIGQQLEP